MYIEERDMKKKIILVCCIILIAIVVIIVCKTRNNQEFVPLKEYNEQFSMDNE